MPRTVWLALICPISLGALFLWSNIGARPIHGETASALAPSDVDNRSLLAKSDRLPSPYFEAAKTAGAVQILPAAPEAATTPNAQKAGDLVLQSKSEASEVTTWHWHAGSKITKRTTVAPRD